MTTVLLIQIYTIYFFQLSNVLFNDHFKQCIIMFTFTLFALFAVFIDIYFYHTYNILTIFEI